MSFMVNITKMSLENGVMGIPVDVCRNWNALTRIPGKLIYAGRECPITFSPKHKRKPSDDVYGSAGAWQFTINDSIQFSKLRIDGVYTYAEGEKARISKREWSEKLECEIYEEENQIFLEVINVIKKPKTNATKKICELLQQGIRPSSEKESKAPEWNSPSAWTNFSEIENYKAVTDCLYIWYGKVENSNTVYLYVGIVGDTKSAGKSKRNLYLRLREEQKGAYKKYGLDIKIEKFRFCSLNNAHGFSVPELLKTIEMSEITIMTSLFNCENARANIDALFNKYDIILLNSSTSYKYVK